MAFRDNALASREREIARLREELEKARSNDGDLEKQLAEAQLELEIEKAKGGKIRRFFNEWSKSREKKRIAKLSRRTFKPSRPAAPSWRSRRRGPGSHAIFLGLLLFAIVAIMGLNVYRYFTDIQEGVVTSKAYHPPETHCSTDKDGHTSCTTYPEHWTVDIAYEGRTATWTVSEGEYRQVSQGDWYCYTDLFHEVESCHGPKD